MYLPDLLAQRAELDKQIAEQKAIKMAEVADRALAVFTDEGISKAEAVAYLISKYGRSARKAPKTKAAAKYRQVSGNATWSGRGVKPQWFKNGDYVAV